MPITRRNHATNYIPFGSHEAALLMASIPRHVMQGRVYSSGAYRFGFNGKEKEADGTADNYDFGARIYDGRLGRWYGIDNKRRIYSELTPYSFAGNVPTSAIDPDGKLIIFINGFYGADQISASVIGTCCGGTIEHWTASWITRVQQHTGDYNAQFFDGGVGGTGNFPFNNIEILRKTAGYNSGLSNAESIVNGLHRNENGDIDEPIRFVTSSMGTAYQRGFSNGLMEYVNNTNKKIEEANKLIDVEIAELKTAQSDLGQNWESMGLSQAEATQKNDELSAKIAAAEAKKQKPINITIEWVIDLDPHQTNVSDPNALVSFSMRSNDATVNSWAKNFVNRPPFVEGAMSLGTMQDHHPSWADETKFPSYLTTGGGFGDPNNPNNVEHPQPQK